MNKHNKFFIPLLLLVFAVSIYTAKAATSPSLGSAATYGVLASTFSNTTAGTIVNGDVGFTTGPAVAPGGVHTNYGSNPPYATAGLNQASALSALAAQPCTFSFASGAIDLATDITHGPVGVYTPGVYCIDGAASIGSGSITLNGSGAYIFRMVGALTTAANTSVVLAGASVCDVWWTPTGATTLGANSTFVGNDIDAAGITAGNLVTWNGQALAFGGTITTANTTITVPACATGSITVNKVSNGANGTFSFVAGGLGFSDFTITTVGGAGVHTQSGLAPGTYSVTESVPNGWTQSSNTCNSITVVSGQNSACSITNTKNAPSSSSSSGQSARLTVIKTVINDDGGTKVVADFPLFVGTRSVTSGVVAVFQPATYIASEISSVDYTGVWGGDCAGNGSVTLVNGDDKICTITNNDTAVAAIIVPPIVPPTITPPVISPKPVVPVTTPVVPSFPNTGSHDLPWNIIAPVGIFALLSLVYIFRKRLVA